MSDKKPDEWKPPRSNQTSLPSPKTRSDDSNLPDHPKHLDSIFEPGTDRVSQSFLDLLNGESAKMSAALQNPANWPAIQRAAREAPAHIAALEEEMGVHLKGNIGAVEVLSPEAIAHKAEVDKACDEIIDYLRREPDIEPSPKLPWWKRALNRILYYVGASVFAAALMPIPNMQLQKCDARFDGAIMEVRCDSTDVCPPGYHLDSYLEHFDGGEDLSALFGYGAVRNTCKLGATVHQPRQVMEVLP